jgi:hypothetical protein
MQGKNKRENRKRKEIACAIAHKLKRHRKQETKNKKYRINHKPNGSDTYKSF